MFREGLPFWRSLSLYHALLTMPWPAFFAVVAAGYYATNVLFALAYVACGPDALQGLSDVQNPEHRFWESFFFSVHTLATIGYGTLAPDSTYAHVIVLVESFVGIGFSALATGVFFARFATPSARVIFSNVAIIGECEGKRMLQFRMANARSTAIVEAQIHVYLSRDEYMPNGDRMRRILDLPLRRYTSPIFALSWVAQHTIDEHSPLFDITPESLRKSTANIVVTFQGTDDRLAATVHTRWAYNLDDIVFDRRFVDIIKIDAKTGVRYLDFTQFHVTEPLTSQASQASPG